MLELLKKCFSSSDEVSFGRTMSAVAFLFCLAWDTFSVIMGAIHYKTLPSLQALLPTSEQLRGQFIFCAGCYGITKIGDIANLIKGGNV